MNESNGQIAIYQTADGQTQIEVTLEQDTVWLSQAQMVVLFGRDVSVISRHIRNALTEGEISEKSNLQKMQIANSDRPVVFYDLDVVISVGYRIKSDRGVQFRRWATNVLRQHLVNGYTLNQQRLEAQQEKMDELRQAIALSARLIHNKNLSPDESRGILTILEKYSHALTVLDDYDHQRLQVVGTRTLVHAKITYDEAMRQIRLWRSQENLGGLFGNKRMIHSRVRWGRSTKRMTARSFIPALKKNPPTCCTLSSRTIRSLMATSVSPPRFLSGFYSAMIFCITPWAKNALPTMRWSHLPC